jgi:hypothetical protein
MHTSDRNATEDTGKISSSNSFHAPTESDGEEEPSTPFSHPAWKPFAAQTAPTDGLVGHSAAHPVVVESFAPLVDEPTVKITVGPEKIKESNPWVEHIEDSDIEYDDIDCFDDVDYPVYGFPYEYDTEDKESVNGETHVSESSPAYMHPVRPKSNRTNGQAMEPRAAIEPRVVVEIGATVKDIPASNPPGTFYDVTKSDSWSMVKQYLDEEKAMLNEISFQNDSESELSDISDSYHPEDEDSFDDEGHTSDYDSDQDQEQVNEQEPSKIPEIPTKPLDVETVVIPDSPPAQTKTPPITPEQTFPSRKRPREEDQDQPSPSTPTPSLPTRPIAPLPSHTIHSDISLLSRLQSDYTNLDTAIDSLREQNSLLRTDLERAAKRQRTERGWRDTAKSVGKYTVAGVVGGIATVVGLVWSAQG